MSNNEICSKNYKEDLIKYLNNYLLCRGKLSIKTDINKLNIEPILNVDSKLPDYKDDLIDSERDIVSDTNETYISEITNVIDEKEHDSIKEIVSSEVTDMTNRNNDINDYKEDYIIKEKDLHDKISSVQDDKSTLTHEKEDKKSCSKTILFNKKDSAISINIIKKPIYNIFVYCCGKSGSSTLHKTFSSLDYKSIHVHNNYYYAIGLNKDETIFNVIERSKLCFEKIYIIDSYRTPIERKISSFFQNEIYDYIKNDDCNNVDIQFLIDKFNNDKHIYHLETYNSMDEVLEYFNIKPIDSFDFEKKYYIYEYDNIVFIKLLFKDIKEWGKILTHIFGKNIKIINDNLSDDKNIKDIYDKFKEKYRVPKKYLDCFLTCDRNFKIFNTPKEQKEYKEYWQKRSF
jgi:hypothetical protein